MRSSLPARLLPAALAVIGLGFALGACGAAAANGPGTGPSSTTGAGGSSVAGSTTTTMAPTTTTANPDLVPQPTAAHPLTMLEIGDSLGEDLGFGLGDLYAHDPWVHVVQDAVGDTGLANTNYYNWQSKLQAELQQYHPGVVVVFLGANDGQNFWYNGQLAVPGNAVWHAGYSARVGALMAEATAAGAKVMWVGMPIMQDPGFWHEIEMINAIYQAEAATHPGVTYFASWPVFASSAGQYVGSIGGVLLRDSDGIHLANGGDMRLAEALVAPMQHTWGITLFPPGTAPAGA